MKLNGPPAFPVNDWGQFGLNVKSRLFCVSNMPVSADKRHLQAAFQSKHCLSVLNIMHLAPKTAPSGRLLNKTAPVGPANDFTNRLFPLIITKGRGRFLHRDRPLVNIYVNNQKGLRMNSRGRQPAYLTLETFLSGSHTQGQG